MQQKRPDLAEEYFRAAVALNPQCDFCHHNLGMRALLLLLLAFIVAIRSAFIAWSC